MVMASSQSVCKHASMFGYFLIGNSVIWSANHFMVYKTATSKRIRVLTVKRRMDDTRSPFFRDYFITSVLFKAIIFPSDNVYINKEEQIWIYILDCFIHFFPPWTEKMDRFTIHILR